MRPLKMLVHYLPFLVLFQIQNFRTHTLRHGSPPILRWRNWSKPDTPPVYSACPQRSREERLVGRAASRFSRRLSRELRGGSRFCSSAFSVFGFSFSLPLHNPRPANHLKISKIPLIFF